MVITESYWNAAAQLLITRLNGHAEMEDVEKWEESFQHALHQIPDKENFKILVDLYGFKAVNLQVHRKFRVVVPKKLGIYGWRVGYLDMFPEAQLHLTNNRGIQCTAAAHVHHDKTKITYYEKHYSRSNERFFIEPKNAMEWIQQLSPINNL